MYPDGNSKEDSEKGPQRLSKILTDSIQSMFLYYSSDTEFLSRASLQALERCDSLNIESMSDKMICQDLTLESGKLN
jgi:hypothetical protein